MKYNVHARELPVAPTKVGDLLDRVADKDNPLWPAPDWPPLVLDKGLESGSDGGHGPIRYEVVDYQPGRRVVFRFHPSIGMEGQHILELNEGTQPGTTLLTHVLIGWPHGSMRLGWPLAVHWLHNALIEDLLDRAAVAVGHPPARPARWSLWVRFLRGVIARRER